tara:strand:+ start:1124 stop:1903 length:780 start_codon:yes stop_codon:yes gene_type:complete
MMTAQKKVNSLFQKSIVFIYGIIAYVIFLVVFLYAIAFVGDFVVPKTINSGVEPTLTKAILINTILLSIFAIQHSVMARPKFKKMFNSVFNSSIERSTYILLTSLALILIYWKWQPINTIVWEVENQVVKTIVIAMFCIGWLIVLLSTFMISHFELFGLTQIVDNFKNRTTPNPKFQTNYLYKVVRHPIMLGFLIAFWATPVMTVGHLMFTIITTLYILIAIKYLEEKDLKKFIGKEYETYQKEVPMIIPFTKMKNKQQ